MIFMESPKTRSDFNLALEQYVFDRMPRTESYILLWQNSPSIIIGKFQNTWEEVNIPYVKWQGIRVTRRLSGGGAVYHDLGNLNFTYIVNDDYGKDTDFSLFCRPLMQTLRALGVNAQITGRNDVTIEGKKFSGNAQYRKDGRLMHHGTIMYESDLNVLALALNVSEDKLRSKGIKSVHSRVTNIREHMEHPVEFSVFREMLKENMCLGEHAETYQWRENDLNEIEKIRLDRYGTWEWNWGKSPSCSVKKVRHIEGCGSFQIYMEISHGCLEECQIYGDFFGEGLTQQLLTVLKGCQLRRNILKKALENIDVGRCFRHLSDDQLIDMILQ